MFSRLFGSSPSDSQSRASQLDAQSRAATREARRGEKMEKSGRRLARTGDTLALAGAATTAGGIVTFNPLAFIPGPLIAGAGAAMSTHGHNQLQYGEALERHASRMIETKALTSLGFSEVQATNVMTALKMAGVLLHITRRDIDNVVQEEFYALAQNKNIGAALRQPGFAQYPADRIKALGTYLRGVEEMASVIDVQRENDANIEQHIHDRNPERYRVCAQTSMQIREGWGSDGKAAVDVGETFTHPGNQEALLKKPRRTHELRTLIAAENRKPRSEQNMFKLRAWRTELQELTMAKEAADCAVPEYDENDGEVASLLVSNERTTENAPHSALEDLAGLTL